MRPAVAKLVNALAGRRCVDWPNLAPDPADAGEVAALTAQLAASQGEVRRLLGVMQERDKTILGQAEELAQLRAANASLADRVNRPSPWHPRVEVAPREPDVALARRAAQDRRNAIAMQQRILDLEALVEALRAGVPA